ncbi:hypothetical protein Dthio_PD0045 [Desulfonatronospira thiodismutans ASO3-1]|uniref:Uncharacterized protein n=1 Tax=Desulfonatronospira thiodismutans ASO3-1 TaxID=555779 RepID=D6SV00_9BACT|nr:hypothetical protein [Desulfonatronospira thiodismutans]EFI32756.1 hypothetical protein Dthio_PD0045 [Desulfonatronospira thiodismutans ASO3-1]
MQDTNGVSRLGERLRQEIRLCSENYHERKLRLYKRATAVLGAAVIGLIIIAVI